MSLVEAAMIDGASRWKIFIQIIMPNVKPAWLTLIIFSVQNLWNNKAATFIYSEEKKTLVYALQQIQSGGIARTGQAAAVTVVVMVVPILIFVLSESFKILWGLVLAAGMLLSPFADVHAEDGLENGYTYNYDYWEEIQYSPDAYSTVGVYTAAELGLDKNLNSPQGMCVQGKEVYICDTGNNRILQLNRTSN